MRLHPVLTFAGIVLGSALASVNGCSSNPASANGGGGAGTCAPATCTAPAPKLITSYADLMTALKASARVRVVLDYTKCKLGGQAGPNAIGGMNFEIFEWFGAGLIGNPKAFVAASETKLIRLSSGFVYDYVRVRVNEDDKVGIDVQYLDPKTFAVTVDEAIDCGMSDGTTERGASFYNMTP